MIKLTEYPLNETKLTKLWLSHSLKQSTKLLLKVNIEAAKLHGKMSAERSAILRVAGYPHISLLHQRLCALPPDFLLHALDVRCPIGGAHRRPIRVCLAGE